MVFLEECKHHTDDHITHDLYSLKEIFKTIYTILSPTIHMKVWYQVQINNMQASILTNGAHKENK